MAWDKNLPADDTELRLGPSYIRDNWAAIEGAETTLGQVGVNLAEQAGDLALNASTYRLYSKNDGTNTELYGINSAGNVAQLTKGLPVLAAAGSTFLPGGLILAWGQDATGANVTVAAMTTIYQVVATVKDTSGTPTDRNIAVNSVVGNVFKIYSSTAGQVSWMAIGV